MGQEGTKESSQLKILVYTIYILNNKTNRINCKKYKLSSIGGEGEEEEGIQNLTTLCRISMLFYKELQICLYLG